MNRSLTVLRPGILTLVEDLGRPGLGAIGVGRSGAADRGALTRANLAVGNDPAAASLEVLLGTLVLRTRGAATMAIAGADIPVTVDGAPVDPTAAFRVPDGAAVRLGTARTGLRGYLAVRGGIAVAPVLGSASTDTLSGLGPARIAAGDVLPIGDLSTCDLPTGDVAIAADVVAVAPADGAPLELVRGPRDDWFADIGVLVSTVWRVSPQSDRVGIRLTGGTLARSDSHRDRELASEGMVSGALQVPPDGAPVLLMRDHPVTGGYPVVGVLTEASVDRAAQLRPGSTVRIRLLH